MPKTTEIIETSTPISKPRREDVQIADATDNAFEGISPIRRHTFDSPDPFGFDLLKNVRVQNQYAPVCIRPDSPDQILERSLEALPSSPLSDAPSEDLISPERSPSPPVSTLKSKKEIEVRPLKTSQLQNMLPRRKVSANKRKSVYQELSDSEVDQRSEDDAEVDLVKQRKKIKQKRKPVQLESDSDGENDDTITVTEVRLRAAESKRIREYFDTVDQWKLESESISSSFISDT